MSNTNTQDTSDPCSTKQSEYDTALRLERELSKKLVAVRSTLNTMKGTVSAPDFTEVSRALNQGDWPEQILGPLDQTSEVFHQYASASFIKCARAVYLCRQAHEAARAAATQAHEALIMCKRTPEYLKWRRFKAQTSACGAPCTSPGRKGQPCHHMLTAKRDCPNHGERPPLAASALA